MTVMPKGKCVGCEHTARTCDYCGRCLPCAANIEGDLCLYCAKRVVAHLQVSIEEMEEMLSDSVHSIVFSFHLQEALEHHEKKMPVTEVLAMRWRQVLYLSRRPMHAKHSDWRALNRAISSEGASEQLAVAGEHVTLAGNQVCKKTASAEDACKGMLRAIRKLLTWDTENWKTHANCNKEHCHSVDRVRWAMRREVR